jgi:hypothetical protein
MKKTYISPAIVVKEVFGDSFMDSNIVSDGGGSYHQDVDPETDPETGDPVRIPGSVWDQ